VTIGWSQPPKSRSTSREGQALLKQGRVDLVETARLLEAMIEEATGVKVISLHHDASTVTGEEVVPFTLAGEPEAREAKPK
jgi:uncharacterized protein YbcI